MISGALPPTGSPSSSHAGIQRAPEDETIISSAFFKLFESIVAFFYRYAFFVADLYKVLSGDTGQNEAVKLMSNELAVFYY